MAARRSVLTGFALFAVALIQPRLRVRCCPTVSSSSTKGGEVSSARPTAARLPRGHARGLGGLGRWLAGIVGLTVLGLGVGAEAPTASSFRKVAEPILTKYCYDCHSDGMSKGGLAFDELKSRGNLLGNHDLWWKVLKYTRAGIMPPEKKDRPSVEESRRLEGWIKKDVFGANPKSPDPGRVTLRRLNRFEYGRTIHDLMGVEFKADEAFPPDDTGYGFDNIADVLTLSPLLLEKYMQAAESIVAAALADPSSRGRFFSKEHPPSGRAERRQYASEVLGGFASKAFRRPVEEGALQRLASLAEGVYSREGKTFEDGVAQAMVAVLCSPRFLFRMESVNGSRSGSATAYIDEYALASRLSYFLWSTMPDEELFRLASRRELRKNLRPQIQRMLADSRSEALVRSFVGQWLQVKDVEGIAIDEDRVLARDKGPASATGTESAKPEPVQFDEGLRRSMRRETELFFAGLLREDRPIVDLLDSDYTYLNAGLAKHYGVPGVTGEEMRRVPLPAGAHRGGLLTQGAILVVTSNPTRTSPVKRGQFVLDNLLGTPAPPPPPGVPPLENAEKQLRGHEPTLRETLELHRESPLCASCHNRMDPLGLALENFNALGMWRDTERGRTIDAAGRLASGESFSGVDELKRILAGGHRQEFYRCLTEKLLTYALGRGLQYYDVETVDQIVERLERGEGRASILLLGIIESAPFQQARAATSHDSGRTQNRL
jgi:hypothetical protein